MPEIPAAGAASLIEDRDRFHLDQDLSGDGCAGAHDAQIAGRLGLREVEASDHVGTILRKLGLAHRAQMTRWVVERGGLQKQ